MAGTIDFAGFGEHSLSNSPMEYRPEPISRCDITTVGLENQMPNRETTIEMVVTATTIVGLAAVVFFGSPYGARGLSEIYGDSDMFGIETTLAITAYRWIAFLFSALLLGYVWLRVRHEERRWASWSALSFAALVTAFVLYGIVLPFASTTFRMGNH